MRVNAPEIQVRRGIGDAVAAFFYGTAILYLAVKLAAGFSWSYLSGMYEGSDRTVLWRFLNICNN